MRIFARTRHLLLLLLSAVLLGAPAAHAAPPSTTAPPSTAAITEIPNFGDNPGNLQMFQYVPEGLPEGRPVVVVLHGCTQNATDYGNDSGWVELADAWQFSLVLPQQRLINNFNYCFNWFERTDTTRGSGEVASVISMVDYAIDAVGADSSRVYVTGLSAGGGMTSALLATYPERFAGGGIVAGIPSRCAAALYEAFMCMNPGKNLSPSAWGDLVRSASSHDGAWPTVSIWHGNADYTVAVANQRELIEQWTNVHGTDATPDRTDTVAGYPREFYEDANGNTVVESVTVTGMGHGQPVDPGTGEGQCGRTAAHVLDVDVCAAWHLGQTWNLS